MAASLKFFTSSVAPPKKPCGEMVWWGVTIGLTMASSVSFYSTVWMEGSGQPGSAWWPPCPHFWTRWLQNRHGPHEHFQVLPPVFPATKYT